MNPVQVAVLLVTVSFVMAIVTVVLSHNLPRYKTWAGAAMFVCLASFMGAVASILLAVWRAFS